MDGREEHNNNRKLFASWWNGQAAESQPKGNVQAPLGNSDPIITRDYISSQDEYKQRFVEFMENAFHESDAE